MIVGVYISPSAHRHKFEEILETIGDCVTRAEGRPVLVGGDFNAHSDVWGSPKTDLRGRILVDWAVELGLVCLNRGAEPTCERPQGSSIVDLMFGTPELAGRVRTWMVLPTVTMSDHNYIHASLSETSVQERKRTGPSERHWRIGALNEDILRASLMAGGMVRAEPD